MDTPQISYLGAFIAGILSFLTPCVLPLIPSYITYITGLSFQDIDNEELQDKIRWQTFFHALAFVVGFTLVFVMLGASATFAGSFLKQHMDTVRKIGGVLIILFGIHTTGFISIRWLLGEKRVNLRDKPAGYLGSLLVGVAFAAGWTPCIGPILASILMIAATGEKVAQGIILLALYSIGLGLPFLATSLAVHRFMLVFNRFKKHIRMFEIITGLFLILVGILIFTNWLSILAGYANLLF
ncbi:MAG: cytochrome c biogenesis protein CcdA [Trichlorobacter sp.]|jgi:cytochrome c-type biogenesis protein|nr:cytochrome c biogenesis protein CcdA [Trichlorobacter sp.]